MKVLYLCSDPGVPVLGRKGASIHVRSLVDALATEGHDVTVVAPLLVGSAEEEPASIAARLIHLPPSAATLAAADALDRHGRRVGIVSTAGHELRRILYDEQLQCDLADAIAGFRPDFVYERATVYGTAGASIASRLAVPLVVELNAPLGLEQSTYRGTSYARFAYEAERHTLSHADHLLTVSSPLRDYAVAQGVAPERVHVVPNGVDPSAFMPGPAAPATRQRWGLGAGPVLGFIGGLRPWHGVRALPAVVEKLAVAYPALQVVIAGDGPLRDDLVSAFREHGVAGRVVFTGALPHEDVPDLVRAFDIAVAPYDEPDHLFYFSPLKLFEYMACGVAVVAARIGQIREVVREEVDGLLYTAGDVHELTAACERLLADEPLRRRLGRAAAMTIRRRFTWTRNAAEVVALVRAGLEAAA